MGRAGIEYKHENNMSGKEIFDKFAGKKKLDGTPMSRQQIHMLRKKARGICLICGKPAVGIYCLDHTVKARERMRVRLHCQRRRRSAASYVLQKQARSKAKSA
jgi:hypothetical protein